MRARKRERVERHAARALSLVAPDLRLLVGWSREAIPWATVKNDLFAEAFTFGRDGVVVIDERRFEAAAPDDREDTVRHELAHLLAWHRHGHAIQLHGREWERARAEIDRALDEEDA